jgi:DNA-binding PadR family transcriptional regulator
VSPAVFAHGRLRLYLLNLLAASDTGMHGYELIQALDERSGGTYVPSAGTIYPRLAKLEEEGLVTKVSDGRKTVYTITDAGRTELAERADELEGIEDDLTDSVRRIADEVRASVDGAMRSLRADLAAATREARRDAKDAARAFRTEATTEAVGGRERLQHADAALTRFRADLRSDLRTHVARGGQLTDETVALLNAGLDELKARVLGSLRG